jgi:hypothetical protein
VAHLFLFSVPAQAKLRLDRETSGRDPIPKRSEQATSLATPVPENSKAFYPERTVVTLAENATTYDGGKR